MPVDLDERLRQAVVGAGGSNRPMRMLNVGSGRDRRHGYVNVDISHLPDVDVVASLADQSLPFPDDTFAVVLCRDILEHVDVVPALRELHRVLAPGGVVVISAVHFTSRNLYVDPTHVRGYSVRTFDFFVQGSSRRDRSYYFDFSFAEVLEASIQFSAGLGRGRYLVWDRLVEPLVNCRAMVQDLYELTFASRMFPAANVIAVLRK
jgi:ubiquinone/menaquinone biosynthesis C-methylase UbiE